jgi:hypothetical protein
MPGRRSGTMQTDVRRRFRSIEAVDPTTLTIDDDRVVVSHGGDDGPAVVIPVSELVRVKVRVLLGIATLLLKTAQGRTTVVDLLLPADAREAAELIEERSVAPEPNSDAAVA